MSRIKQAADLLPAGFSYRELWEAKNIVGTNWPTSAKGGHPLSLVNEASKATTVAGVHGDGSGDSNIDLGAIHGAATKLWISMSFTLDQAHAAGGTTQYLFGDKIDNDNFFYLRLDGTTGALIFKMEVLTDLKFTVTSTETSWAAGVRYHVIASISSAEGVRLIVDDGTPVTDADTSAMHAGDDFILMDQVVGDATGLKGTLHNCVIGTDDLSAAEEADLYNGIPPADAVNLYKLDEGRGTTATDRGSGADDATLGSTAAWAFGGTKQIALSQDGINDYAQSAALVNFTGDTTMVWVGKMKSTYELTRNTGIMHVKVGTHQILLYSPSTNDGLSLLLTGDVGTQLATYAHAFTIGEYAIIVMPVTAGGTAYLYHNGAQGASVSSYGDFNGNNAALATRDQSGTYDPSSPILLALVEGAMDDKQAKEYTRNLSAYLGLGI